MINILSNRKKEVLKYIFTIFISIITFFFWVNNFLENESWLKSGNEIIILSVLCFVTAIFLKDSFYMALIIIFSPFIYSEPFYVNGIPKELIIAGSLLLISLVLHLVIFKIKIKMKGKFLFGIIMIVLSMILGGINLESPNKITNLLIVTAIGISFIIVYLFFTTSVDKVSFNLLCFILSMLGLLIVFQSIVFYLNVDNFIDNIWIKNLDLGWGCSNNVAMMYLLTIPFSFYFVFNYKKLIFVLSTIVVTIQILFLFFTYSRGGIFSFILLYFLIILTYLIGNVNNKSAIIGIIFVALMGIAICLFLMIKNYEMFSKMIETITKADLENLNGRKEIYERVIENFKENPIFGKGLLSFSTNIDGEENYLWAHGTVFQTIESFGIIGLISLLIHLFQKYFLLIKKINLKKSIILISFLSSGFYGLFDISYYYIVYMVVFLIILIFIDKINFDDNTIIDYIAFNQNDIKDTNRTVLLDGDLKRLFNEKNRQKGAN